MISPTRDLVVSDRMRRGPCTRVSPNLQDLALVAKVFPRRTDACGLGSLREMARVSPWHRASGVDYHSHSGLGSRKSSVWRTDVGETGSGGSRTLLKSRPAPRILLEWIREHESVSNPRIGDWLSRIEADIQIGGFPRTGMNVLAYFSYPSGHQESASCYVLLERRRRVDFLQGRSELRSESIRTGTSSSAWSRTTRRCCTSSRNRFFSRL